MTEGPAPDPSPFSAPRTTAAAQRPQAPIGMVRAMLGILLCISGTLQLGLLTWFLLTEDFDPWFLLVAFTGIGALVAGWRWSAREPAGFWLVPATMQVPFFVLLAHFFLFVDV